MGKLSHRTAKVGRCPRDSRCVHCLAGILTDNVPDRGVIIQSLVAPSARESAPGRM
jgi:hypothetical protein